MKGKGGFHVFAMDSHYEILRTIPRPDIHMADAMGLCVKMMSGTTGTIGTTE
ncbi:hypothetical protein LZ24_00556 [Desulfobotulus alkaliphilus]|uniref:Uncharacterized protein n=1 Tax=Desulfobotulus alkaliphilus TaxID=622671 RepID=A0A562S885_9BACT|nr:hypothetical protein [Desulfobotulus alkaliphilus]TWI76934.1 hypothetical protein LZ24_00556 [Desulfobotulus alkaliphilus]